MYTVEGPRAVLVYTVVFSAAHNVNMRTRLIVTAVLQFQFHNINFRTRLTHLQAEPGLQAGKEVHGSLHQSPPGDRVEVGHT